MTGTEWELNHYWLSEYMNGGVCQVCDVLDIIGGQGYHYHFWPLFCKDFPRLQEFCLFQVVLSPQTLILSYCEQWFLDFTTQQNHLNSSGVEPRICIFNKHLIGRQVAHAPHFERWYLYVKCLYLLYHLEFQLIHGL